MHRYAFRGRPLGLDRAQLAHLTGFSILAMMTSATGVLPATASLNLCESDRARAGRLLTLPTIETSGFANSKYRPTVLSSTRDFTYGGTADLG